MPSPVNTKTCDRRLLRFNSLADLRVDLDRIEVAARAEALRTSGNWTPGQILGHVAAWMSYPYEGFPMGRAPWFVRLLVGMQRNRFLNKGMPRGVRIPGTKDGTYGTDDMPVDAGLSRLRRAAARLETDTRPPHASPVFGALGHDEWVRLNLRHAELHLGFIHWEG